MPSILCCSLLLLPSVFPASESFLMSWLFRSGSQILELHFSISTFNEYSGLISFRINLFDVLAVQGTLKNLLQHHSLKASVLWSSALFMVHVSHPYLTTGKTIALTRWTFDGKVSSLLFNTLSRCHNFPSKEQVSFIFVAAVTVCSDFGAQENKMSLL